MKPEQITAWALNELSAEERASIEAALRENPATGETAHDMKEFCDFLLHELRDESLALTPEQRERLQSAETPRNVIQPTFSAPRPRWRFVTRFGPIAAAAACAVLGGFLMVEGMKPKTEAVVAAEPKEKEFRVQLDRNVNMPNPEGARLGALAPATPGALPLPVGTSTPANQATGTGYLSLSAATPGSTGKTLAEQIIQSGTGANIAGVELGKSGLATFDNPQVASASGGTTSSWKGNISGAGSTNPNVILSGANTTMGSLVGDTRTQAGAGALQFAGGNVSGTGALNQTSTLNFDNNAAASLPLIASAPSPAGGGTMTWTAAGGQSSASAIRYVDGTAPPAPAARPLALVNGPLVNNPVPSTQYERRLAEQEVAGRARIVGGFEEKGETEALVRRKATMSNESYTAIVENELKDVLREPLSTFSIDVDTASYANVRRFLNQNMIPPRDAVRIEELVNYFPTHEEGPAAEAKEPFATRVELAACPWQPRHKLARISIQGREIEKNSKSSNLVFLVDVSGSMNEPQKLPLVQQSLRMLAEQLGEGDRVAMVTYASGTQVVLPPTNGQNRAQIIAAVDQLRAGGSTNGAGGLQLAYEQAVAGFVQGGINRVILCTDGDFNVGISDPAQLEKFIADKARSGVFLSVLGFGSGNLKDRTMESLADKGNGNYAYIDGLAEARKVLVEQMSGTLVTIAKDVKIQIEFNPALVRSYRLIGYENRLLAKEDFNDDTKDAGEIGSGHSVVALYELVPANLPPGEEPARIVDTLKYQTLASPMPDGTMPKLSATAKDSKEIMTVKLRYKQPEGETSQKIEVPVMDADKAITAASAEFKFSAAAAAFGLLLRDSSYKGALTWETVRKLALEGKGPDALGYRGEFLQLIDKAAGLKGARP
ncbi:MAG: von Willebrand factor type A domain-containing protein [Verrucomicrobiaceae bacterium]|nr:von Willebrand factor type A domain-containing protein [Verrucomicrobiaceae bacterium]